MKTTLNIVLCFTMMLLVGTVAAQSHIPDYYYQYNELYADCVDNEYSKVYSLEEPYLEPPLFPGGGPVQMSRYVYFQTEYPDVKDESGEQLKGKVLVEAIVDRCGVVGKVKVIESLDPEYDKEARRVVESFPVFMPASLDDVRVKVKIIVPVYFTRTYVPKKQQIYYDGEYYDYYNYDDYNYDYDY